MNFRNYGMNKCLVSNKMVLNKEKCVFINGGQTV